MELETVVIGALFLILGFAALKTYSVVEIQKQERICEERERKAAIYAKKDLDIARAETSIYSTGFDESDTQASLTPESLLSLMNNPEIAKLAQQFLKPKE